MKNLSNIDMSDLAKEWEAQMGTRNQAQTHNYRLLYGEKVNESEKAEGVKTEKVKLAPRPMWKAP
jgi:hypothetical protein